MILQIIPDKCGGKHLCCQHEGQDYLSHKRSGENRLKCSCLLCWYVNLVEQILTSIFEIAEMMCEVSRFLNLDFLYAFCVFMHLEADFANFFSAPG